MKRIASRDNPGFKALRALAEDPREVRRQRRTLLDGIHLVAACLAAGWRPQQLLFAESACDRPDAMAIAESNPGIETLVMADPLFRAISGVAAPVGIAAVIGVPADADGGIDGDAVVLDAIQDAGNVGTLMRTAAAAGVRHVVLGQGCAGAWSPRVLRAAQGAHFSLAIREGVDLPSWLAASAGMSPTSIATVVSGAEPVHDADLRGRCTWLFGNEGAGLDPHLVDAAARRVTIPLAAATESLNVAAAAAVCLFEMRRQRNAAASDAVPPAPTFGE